MPPTPIALPPALPSELLECVLAHQAYPTTLIICSSRAAFLSSLLATIKHTSSTDQEHVASPLGIGTGSPASPDPVPLHPLLIPSLHQVATSRYIKTLFMPTVSHLRAYLSIFPGPSKHSEGTPPLPNFARPGTRFPLVVVYGLLELHRDTSEWSAQGLSSTIAALVEAGARTARRVVVLEQRALAVLDDGAMESGRISDEEGDQDFGDTSRQEKVAIKRELWKGWKERVPILNGSVRRAGLETEDGGWSGRTIETGRLFGRWFRLGRSDWEADENVS